MVYLWRLIYGSAQQPTEKVVVAWYYCCTASECWGLDGAAPRGVCVGGGGTTISNDVGSLAAGRYVLEDAPASQSHAVGWLVGVGGCSLV